MLFNSLQFLMFFPVAVLLYYLLPNRFRYIWLLVCSYFFYMCWNVKYIILLIASTIVTYLSGLLIEKVKNNTLPTDKTSSKAKWIVAGSFTLNLTLLGVFKYFNFFMENLQKFFNLMNIEFQTPKFSLLLPVGISFYVFQALGYTMDVYRGEVKAEKNFLKYAVFVSFFPQLVAGPIERTKNLLSQFDEEHKFNFDEVKSNLLLMAWGFFIKMVIADRIAIFVDAVYGNYTLYDGWYIVVASILFAFQIYCDFAGYSIIAMGAAGVMGFRLMENFRSPYCAVSVKDFWSRWHISLTSWFRDYLYIPLGGNRKGKVRKYLNQIIVFCVSGLWHGAMWSYVIWGGLNGLFLVIGEATYSIRTKMKKRMCLKQTASSNKILSALLTFLLVDFSWIFFRASGTKEALYIIRSMCEADNFEIFLNGSLYGLGLDQRNFVVMLLSILLLIIVDVLHTKEIHIRTWITQQNLWCRWLIYIGLIEAILVFGIWGVGYDKASFIYFQF